MCYTHRSTSTKGSACMSKSANGKKSIVVKKLAKGVSVTVSAEYKTSDGRTWTNGKEANTFQTFLNRTEAVKEVLRDSGLLAYKNNPNILSVGPLADRLVDDDFLDRLMAAATVRNPRQPTKRR